MIQSPSDEEILQEVKLSLQLPQVTERINNHKIIAKAAADAGIEPDVEALQAAADQIRVSNNLNSAAETYAWLEKYGLSVDDFEELALRICLKDQLAEYLFKDKIEPYFVQRKLDYMSAVLYEVRFEDEDEAMEAYYDLQAGETTFSQIAYQYIKETELRRVGGYLGDVPRSKLGSEVAAAVFAASPPQVLKPIMFNQGVYLICVEEIRQPLLTEQLRAEIIVNLFDDFFHFYSW
jgi:parvulin-like peptidyl-prolyl isomerase